MAVESDPTLAGSTVVARRPIALVRLLALIALVLLAEDAPTDLARKYAQAGAAAVAVVSSDDAFTARGRETAFEGALPQSVAEHLAKRSSDVALAVSGMMARSWDRPVEVPYVYVGPGAVVEKGARLGSLAVLGAGARLAEGGIVENAVVGARTNVGVGASVIGSIVGDEAELGSGTELHNLSVVGPGARVGGGNVLDHGLRVGAGQHIPDEALRFS